MNLTDAIAIITNYAYELSCDLEKGLPGGSNEEIGYDEQLAIDIAKAWDAWETRQDAIQDPWCVWFFDGIVWLKYTDDMYQEDAYKEWYRLTKGATEKKDSRSETYFHLGSSREELKGRHRFEEEEDDFSIAYSLAKSFGE